MFTSICVANGSVRRLSTRATAWCGTQSLARRKSKPSEGDRNRGNLWRAAQGLEMLEIIFRLLNILLRIPLTYSNFDIDLIYNIPQRGQSLQRSRLITKRVGALRATCVCTSTVTSCHRHNMDDSRLLSGPTSQISSRGGSAT